ncbi:MAG TPA: biopolymer transporter ExbD [Verrucomicrobiales bacterium]|jgi:biopolymer transport protein ExbD|nr:biopolymer transporter ExbD [Verrucomicrobiales bacterium]
MKLHSTIRIRPDFLYLAPLLNVVMLLLVFFLLNSAFVVRSGYRVELPVSGSSLKPIERAHIVTITSRESQKILLNNQDIALGDLTARLIALKKDCRYVVVNSDSTAASGLQQKVINAILDAGCDAAVATRAEGE